MPDGSSGLRHVDFKPRLETEQAKPDGKPPEMLLYFRKVGPANVSKLEIAVCS